MMSKTQVKQNKVVRLKEKRERKDENQDSDESIDYYNPSI